MAYLSHLEYMAKTDTILPQFLKLRNETPELALKLLMDYYGDTMYGVTLRILDEKSLADDALQEGFVKIWKNITEFNPEIASLFTWMLTIIRNTAIDVARKEKNRKIIVTYGHANAFLSGPGSGIFTAERKAEANDARQNEEQLFERIDAYESERISRKADNFS